MYRFKAITGTVPHTDRHTGALARKPFTASRSCFPPSLGKNFNTLGTTSNSSASATHTIIDLDQWDFSHVNNGYTSC